MCKMGTRPKEWLWRKLVNTALRKLTQQKSLAFASSFIVTPPGTNHCSRAVGKLGSFKRDGVCFLVLNLGVYVVFS